MKARRKISAIKADFLSEIKRLQKFDAENQKKYSAGKPSLSKREISLLTESIFFSAFREYENFIRDVFLIYSLGNSKYQRRKIISYLQPKDFFHAEKLMQSSMPFLEWNSPDEIIERSELYFVNGYPFKVPYATNLQALKDYKRVRNHIAHNSSASLAQYIKVLKNHYGTIPLNTPSPGEFLLESERRFPGRYKLLTFFDLIINMANGIT